MSRPARRHYRCWHCGAIIIPDEHSVYHCARCQYHGNIRSDGIDAK